MSIALIFGATGGIGEQVSYTLAKDGFGLLLVARNKEQLDNLSNNIVKKVPKCKIQVNTIDVSNLSYITDFFKNFSSQLKNLTAVVNCIGISAGGDLSNTTIDEWNSGIMINLSASFFISQGAINIMKYNKIPGSIVLISSYSSVIGAKKPTYGAAKSGLLGLTRSLAINTAEYAIRVNCITPGAVDTPFIADWNEEKKSILTKNIPLKRISSPEEIAKAAAFLISDNSSYITGINLNVTGGLYM